MLEGRAITSAPGSLFLCASLCSLCLCVFSPPRNRRIEDENVHVNQSNQETPMPFIKIGNRVLNTRQIASLELEFEQSAFSPPDIDLNDPSESEEKNQKLSAN